MVRRTGTAAPSQSIVAAAEPAPRAAYGILIGLNQTTTGLWDLATRSMTTQGYCEPVRLMMG
jgi:hypothetical protein